MANADQVSQYDPVLRESTPMGHDPEETANTSSLSSAALVQAIWTLGSDVDGDVPKHLQVPCTPLSLSCGRRSRADMSSPISMAKSETSPEARPGDHSCRRTGTLFHLDITYCYRYL